jgi:hypothetical protein
MADFYRQFAFVSSVLAGFSFTFYGTLLMATREHWAGTWAAFLAVAASVAFLPVTLGMTFTAARAANQPSEFSISNAVADPQLVLSPRLGNLCAIRQCTMPNIAGNRQICCDSATFQADFRDFYLCKEAGAGIEPANSGFADRDLTTWLPRRVCEK